MTIALSVLSVAASVVGIYGVYWAIIRERKKLFAYEVSRGLAVASASRMGGDYELSVHFKPKDGEEEKIEGAYLQFVRFANLGLQAVREKDNAPANPLRLVVSGARVLDIALVDQKREVNQVKLSSPKLSDSGGESLLTFDYLDHRDGALVRVLTAGRPELIEIRGDVIDMPGGIVCTSPEASGGIAFKVGFTLWLIGEIALFGFTAWIFYKATGSWAAAWLIPLPILAFIAPIVIALIVDESSSKFRRASWRRRFYPDLKFPGDFPFGELLFERSVRPSDMRTADIDKPQAKDEVARFSS